MELKEFISNALTQIVAGIVEAQEGTKDIEVEICPSDSYTVQMTHINISEGRQAVRCPVYNIEFELLLQESNNKNKGLGIGVYLGNIGIDAKSESGVNKGSYSKVSFTVPVVYPFSPKKFQR